jgi:hypothetical protein
MKRKHGGRFPKGAKKWNLDETLNFISQQKNNPDFIASEKFRNALNNLAQDNDVQNSPVFVLLIEVLQDCVQDFSPDWTLDDFLEPLEMAIKSHGGKVGNQGRALKYNEIKDSVISEWLKTGMKRGTKESFSHDMAKKYQIKFMTIYKDYLSERSIAEYLKI